MTVHIKHSTYNTFSPKEAVDHRADSKHRHKDDSRHHQRVVHSWRSGIRAFFNYLYAHVFRMKVWRCQKIQTQLQNRVEIQKKSDLLFETWKSVFV